MVTCIDCGRRWKSSPFDDFYYRPSEPGGRCYGCLLASHKLKPLGEPERLSAGAEVQRVERVES